MLSDTQTSSNKLVNLVGWIIWIERIGLFEPWRREREVVPKRWYGNNILLCVRSPKSADLTLTHTHSLPSATTHAGSCPTQEVASNHLYPWPCSSNVWLPASLHPSSLHPSIHPSIWGLAFPLAFCPPACPRWFSYMVDYLAFILYVLPISAWLS